MPVLTMDTWLLIGVITAYALFSYALLHRAAKRDDAMRHALQRLSEEAHAQTQIMQRAYRGQIEKNDNATQQAILTAMQQSGFYEDRNNRDVLVERLDDKFIATLRRGDSMAMSTDLRHIISRAWRWNPGAPNDAILALLDCAIDDLDDSASGIALQRIRDELRPYRAVS